MDTRTYRRTIPAEITGTPCNIDLPLPSSCEASPRSDNPDFSDPLPNIADFNPGHAICFQNDPPAYSGEHQNASPLGPDATTPTTNGRQSEFRNLGHPSSQSRPEAASYPLHPVGDGWPRLPNAMQNGSQPRTPQTAGPRSSASQAQLCATSQPDRLPALAVRKAKKRLRTASLDAELDSEDELGPELPRSSNGKRPAAPVNSNAHAASSGDLQTAPAPNAFYHTWSQFDSVTEKPAQEEQAGHVQAQAHPGTQTHPLLAGMTANAAAHNLPAFDDYIQGAIHNYYTKLTTGQELLLPLLQTAGGSHPLTVQHALTAHPAANATALPLQNAARPPPALLKDSIHAPESAQKTETVSVSPPENMEVDEDAPEHCQAPAEPPQATSEANATHARGHPTELPVYDKLSAPRDDNNPPVRTAAGPKLANAHVLPVNTPKQPPPTAPNSATMPRVMGRAEYLRESGILNVLSVTNDDFPKKHAQSTRDLLRGLPESMAETWEGLSGKNHVILEVLKQERRSDQPYLDAVEKVIRSTFGKILGTAKLTLLSATAGQNDAPGKPLALIWMLYDCSDNEVAILAQQLAWPTPDLTAFVHTVFVGIPDHLITYTGFKIPYDVTIKKGVTATFLQDDPFRALVKLLKLEHGDRPGVDYAAMARAVIQGIRVKSYRVGKPDGPGEIVASVYCDPPTTNAGAWYTWQCTLFNTTVKTDLNEVAVPRDPVRCRDCQGGDHDERNCPFEEVEGWFGKLNLGPIAAPSAQQQPQQGSSGTSDRAAPRPQPPTPPPSSGPASAAQAPAPHPQPQRPPTRARTPPPRVNPHHSAPRDVQPHYPQNGPAHQQPPPPYSSAASAWPPPLPPPHMQPMLRQPYTATYPMEPPYPPYYPQHQPYYYHPQFYAQPQYAPPPGGDRSERHEEYEDEGYAGQHASQYSTRGRGGYPPRGGQRRRGQNRSQNPPAPRM
ncbi:uncharacterized protein TRAVEDRAFT_23373 [Trametes versicolor FP-101664 SS1]|uniref:uncharacterized protein n=1 Tax=Trametes versicolor (strain FP-101664) TaxID=717944 RepID=UPI000462329D|nr:uncharacterized protein TRAVEDRAFT_23373 [Trametes versicolor FP-101664 SS1]EIW54199.1 hypothetical protein TRAVEDRAFT_23373 [Trametes versicolor FP-101664 SS1]